MITRPLSPGASALVAGFAFAACGGPPTGAPSTARSCPPGSAPATVCDRIREPAFLTWQGSGRLSVTHPDTAHAGTPIVIRFGSVGGMCREPAATDVTVNELVAELTAWIDVVVYAGLGCELTAALRHKATVQFEKSGSATIRISGTTGDRDARRPFTIERTLVILPRP